MEFIPLQDLGDDADAIVARIKAIAGEDHDMLKSASDNLVVEQEDEGRMSIWRKVIPRSRRGEGSPHGGKRR